jgi:3-deoxy-D-manno-octulosonic-acid transferase
MGRLIYGFLLWLALPGLFVKLWWRGLRETGYRERIGERFGFYRDSPDRQDLDVIWVHAVSMGETRAASLLVRMLAEHFPSNHVLVTHMTATGRQAAAELFAQLPTARIAWLPYDYPFAVRRFLERYRPRVAILMETELWPNLIRGCHAAGVPVILANARMSEKSARGYRRLAPLFREVFPALDAILAQSESDRRRLLELGVNPSVTMVSGNLKFDVASGKQDDDSSGIRRLIGVRPVFLAASTRDGEEALLLDALAKAEETKSGLPEECLVMIVPRHPQRFDAVADLLKRRSASFVRRSAGRDVPSECRFMLGDSLGEMAAYYAAADCAFVGGSLLPLGGQNLIEACAAGVPVLVGPHTFNFAEASDQAVDAGAAVRVATAEELIEAAAVLLGDPVQRRKMGEAGKTFCRQHVGATARTVAVVEQLIARRT